MESLQKAFIAEYILVYTGVIWWILRAEAVKHGKPIGKFISVLVEEHVKRESSGSNWDVILRRKPFLTAAEAEAVKKAAGVFEQSYGFED